MHVTDSPPAGSAAELNRFSSRTGRLSHVFLKDRLTGAKTYRRIAGYFRSSVFELVEEEIAAIDCGFRGMSISVPQ